MRYDAKAMGQEFGFYIFSTPDACDAHDFESDAAAKKWMESRPDMSGEVRMLNDDGSWPVEDEI